MLKQWLHVPVRSERAVWQNICNMDTHNMRVVPHMREESARARHLRCEVHKQDSILACSAYGRHICACTRYIGAPNPPAEGTGTALELEANCWWAVCSS